MPGSSSLREPCFCRHMNKADEIILSIPSDATCKLWGVDKGPTNVMIHTDDGRIFNVWLSESKGNLFFFQGWSNVTQHLGLSEGCLPLVAPIDAVNEIYEEPHSRVHRFSRMAGTDFMLPDRVSQMAKLNLGLKDITVRLLNRDPSVQFTNGTRRERTRKGFRYALRRWSKFMKTAGIKVRDTVDYSFDENEQVLSVEKVVAYVSCGN
ncbi:uncharacterized protein LOC118486736 isoform X2 [Helianthus annuus]|uniref:uncharacterized protein LOC118486736 isoform X2 n=1 Tax=Helianthus annuus TaxID=4232 RepID=UPI001652C362|nr:uncharacterized protein LOC118486736 isoform X2 [Helianthus annuus]XP_035839307.1 uncharacterized protein LOC118486736 isoform X2 [Helianthus annuus]